MIEELSKATEKDAFEKGRAQGSLEACAAMVDMTQEFMKGLHEEMEKLRGPCVAPRESKRRQARRTECATRIDELNNIRCHLVKILKKHGVEIEESGRNDSMIQVVKH